VISRFGLALTCLTRLTGMFEPTEATRVAVECLTIWLETDKEKAAEHIAHLQHSPDGPGATTMISGFLNLGELLVLSLAKERGAGGEDIRQKAGDILREWSVQLPE
jgi:hypothetical protein